MHVLAKSIGEDYSLNWSPTSDPCTQWPRVQCDSSGRITTIQIGHITNLSGTIPPDVIPNLTFLVRFEAQQVGLSGPLLPSSALATSSSSSSSTTTTSPPSPTTSSEASPPSPSSISTATPSPRLSRPQPLLPVYLDRNPFSPSPLEEEESNGHPSPSLGQLFKHVGDATSSSPDHHILHLQNHLLDDSSSAATAADAAVSRHFPFVLSLTNLNYRVNTSSRIFCRREPSDPSANNSTKILLDGISGEAREGEILAVLGASGSGKSTLIDALDEDREKEKEKKDVRERCERKRR